MVTPGTSCVDIILSFDNPFSVDYEWENRFPCTVSILVRWIYIKGSTTKRWCNIVTLYVDCTVISIDWQHMCRNGAGKLILLLTKGEIQLLGYFFPIFAIPRQIKVLTWNQSQMKLKITSFYHMKESCWMLISKTTFWIFKFDRPPRVRAKT